MEEFFNKMNDYRLVKMNSLLTNDRSFIAPSQREYCSFPLSIRVAALSQGHEDNIFVLEHEAVGMVSWFYLQLSSLS